MPQGSSTGSSMVKYPEAFTVSKICAELTRSLQKGARVHAVEPCIPGLASKVTGLQLRLPGSLIVVIEASEASDSAYQAARPDDMIMLCMCRAA